METQTLQAEVRKEGGKGPARQLRVRGLIPAVFYGPGTTPTSLAVSPKELAKAISGAHGRNAVLSLKVDGKDELALVKELQIHPLSRELRHVDLYRVELGREVLVQVPFTTHGKAAGVQKGGEQHNIFRKLPVRTTPDKIPSVIDVDVSALDVNETIAVKDVTLPAGVAIALSSERTLVAMYSEERKKRAHAEEEAAGPAAAAAAPAAAPAADAKKK